MALKDVLSLIGSAVAEDPGAARFRRSVLRHPGLSANERRDLLAIPHGRLAVYAADRRAETEGMLRWGLPYSWRALTALGFDGAGGDKLAFVGRLNRLRPNRTHSVRELARQFVAHVTEDCPALAIVYPWLLELAKAERLEVVSLYASDLPTGQWLGGEALPAFFSRTVEQVLDEGVVRAEGTATFHMRYDIFAIKGELDALGGAAFALGGQTPFMPLTAPRFAVVARHPETLRPLWRQAGAMEARLFERFRPGAPAPLLDLAAAYCEAAGQRRGETSEERLLQGFLTMLASWFEQRYVLLDS